MMTNVVNVNTVFFNEEKYLIMSKYRRLLNLNVNDYLRFIQGLKETSDAKSIKPFISQMKIERIK